ncbi:MAG: hypothetical protein NTX71_11680 [Candidatus Aureabacteria bacterium]|nr:hypothetical protein [Candidatus Auribacterota bacterium]
MTTRSLRERVAQMGFPLLGVEEDLNVNETLAEVVKSKELRLWEAFPVLLARSVEKGLFDYSEVSSGLTTTERDDLDSLVRVSCALYRALGLKFDWCRRLESLPPLQEWQGRTELKSFKARKDVKAGSLVLSTDRMMAHFQSYFNAEERNLRDLLAHKEEYSLEVALSQIFSPKQKELFLKKLKGDKLSKTEMEYYSRRVKKKALALANEELHKLARSL